MVHITPLDIQQKQFRPAFRGLDRREVDAFLNSVAEDWERVLSELHALKEHERRQERIIESFREREQLLQETLVSAQQMKDDIAAQARKEADLIIGRAELEAERIVERAHERLTALLGEIAELKRNRVALLQQIKGVAETHLKLVELAGEGRDDPRGDEGAAALTRPRRVVIPPAPEAEAQEAPRQVRGG